MTYEIYTSMFQKEPEVLTVPETSKLLRIGINKTYRLINSGTLVSLKIGGKIIVPKVRLIEFLTEQNKID